MVVKIKLTLETFDALKELVRIKERKDAEGKYPGYEEERDAAWEAARRALNNAQG